jgi:hypothetical protein
LDSAQIQGACETHSLLPKCMYGPLLAAPSGPAGISIPALYNNLINTRVASLPINIPARVRLQRERLSRLIATELYLSSIGISVKPLPEQLVPPASQLVPIPPPSEASQKPPSQDGFDWPGNSSKNTENEPLQRIRAYAPIQRRVALPDGIGRVLESWKIGEDPSEFEFFVDPEEGVPRYRNDRKKIRKQKQLLEQISRGPVALAGDGIPGVFGGSQPPSLAKGRAGTQASHIQSQGQNQNRDQRITMTQIEKGKHGGRKQKKRKTGF